MRKRIGINIAATSCYVLLSMGINLILAPYIVEKLGNEAYGFNTLSDNFTSYALIITMALNYMGCRFISYEYHKKNMENARYYFNSLLVGDIILAGILSVISFFCVFCLQNIITIQEELVYDVKITFALTFASFIISILETAFTAGSYVGNRMDLNALKMIVYNVIRAGFIFVFYTCLEPKIYYISLAAIIGNVCGSLMDIYFTKKLLPELCVNFCYFKKRYIAQLLSSGIWNSVVSLGNVLANGLDLLIANEFVDSYHMGLLALAKTIPTALKTLMGALSNVFNPYLTKVYAKGDKEQLAVKLKDSIRILSCIMNVPLAGFTVFGYTFYKLWVPSKTEEEIMTLTVLSILVISGLVVSANLYTLSYAAALVNRLKLTTIASIVSNIISLIFTLLIVRSTSLGVFAIAGVSAAVSNLYQLFFLVPYAAFLIERKWWEFYPVVIRGLSAYLILLLLFFVVQRHVQIGSWIQLIGSAGSCGAAGYLMNIFFMLKKEERCKIISRIRKKG